MTPEKFTEKIAFHLRKHGVYCPACHNSKFEIPPIFTRLPVLANAFQPQPDGVFPLVTACCSKCRHVLLFDVQAIPGLIEQSKAIIAATEIPAEVKKKINLG